jgi:hypothetical protein
VSLQKNRVFEPFLFLATLRPKNGSKRFDLFIFLSRFQNGSTYGVLKPGLSHFNQYGSNMFEPAQKRLEMAS